MITVNQIESQLKEKHPEATISELIYVPNSIKDGAYLLNLQIALFRNDASPCKPILYQFI